LALGVVERFMEPISTDGTLVTIVLAIIAALAVLTIVAIIVGQRKRAKRAEAERAEAERLEHERIGTDAPSASSAPLTGEDSIVVPVATPAPSAPIAPPPPPLADLPEVAPSPVRDIEPEPEPVAESPPLANEPIAAAAPLDASPAAEAQPPAQAPPTTPAGAPSGDAPVTRIKGLGPKVAARLAELGIVTVGDLAALDQRAAEDLDARLGPFTGRLARDRWLEQAQLLAGGDVKTFEERFGKL
jgi:predicted flap endonuclease-1-like 5' DNA nuclease